MGIEQLKSLTSKDRILLYLSDFLHMEDRFELPQDLTQEAIAYCTGIQRKHLSQYLKDLENENLLTQRKAHIHGMKQRMNGYYLTPLGHSKAAKLKIEVGAVKVPVKNNGQTVMMRVSDIDDATSAHITFCDIVREAIQKGSLSIESLEMIEASKREALEKKEQSTDIYKRALQTAWRDGRVTASERFLIDLLKKELRITEDQHKALEQEILNKLAQDHMEFLRVYRSVLEVALADGELLGPEVEILENLRRVFRISREEHEEVLREVKIMMIGPSSSSEANASNSA